ncbi:hypothetical protein BDZ89DRAFT_974973 [Hymenopellis radicata]|nr:hypothetical protein BDZ89DRAFT_974973 [Hymenopellis radicata]
MFDFGVSDDEPEPEPERSSSQRSRVYHQHLNGLFLSFYFVSACTNYYLGQPCDENGHALPPGTPKPATAAPENPWEPFPGEQKFRLADFLYRQEQMSQANVDELMKILALSEASSLFANHQDMYNQIDGIKHGSAPWKCFVKEIDPNLRVDAPDYEREAYQVWYRDVDTVISNILANPDFADEFDTTPYVELGPDGKQRWSDFMSGGYAWRHAVYLHGRSSTSGAMVVHMILGSDKTTVSVATGNVEYWPLYLSIGNLHNGARRAHRNGVVPIGFLAIPKSDRKYDNDDAFRAFKKKLFHRSLEAIFRSVKPAMSTPVVRMCPNGYYRRVIYDFGAYIADYPEQVLLAGVVSGWCPK